MKNALLLAAVLAATPAFADDEAPSPAAEPPAPEERASDEPTAADVASAPLPGQESGRLDEPEGDSVLRDVAQGALLVPRVGVEVAMAPVRVGIYAYEKYAMSDRFKRSFFDDTNTYGLYPTVYYDATYGATIGGRVVHRNLFGQRERMSLRAATGGEFRTMADGHVRTGRRLGENVSLELRGQFEQRPEDRFFGIGNSDDVVEVRHRQQLMRATSTLDVRPFSSFHLRAAGAITDSEYAVSPDGPMITEVYDESMLTGFSGARYAYGELELRWDSRAKNNRWDQHAVFDGGSFVGVFAGRMHQLESMTADDYGRYGVEAQHFMTIRGARTVATRLHIEGITGGLDDVPFTQLPQLGGSALLRGYPAERFRDRAAVLGSVEYFWDLSRYLMASLFVDVGRVYPSLADFELTGLRAGFGASVQLHSARSFIAGLNIASSIDGGVFVNLAFDPVFEPEPRVEQK